MKPLTTLVFAAVLIAVGCTHITPPVSAERKAELRKILDPKFMSTSVPKEKEEEFYGVLDGFTDRRKSNELVRSVEFKSHSEATLTYSDSSGFGGGGVAGLKKKSGSWRIVMKASPYADPIYADPMLPVSTGRTEPNQASEPTAPSGRGSP